MNDYERIARIIRYVDAHAAEQPDLAELACEAGLSSFHFHRLFSEWAGVTPKDFLQFLTLARARKLLQAGENVLDSAFGAGVSSPGRLHDLCVTLEAASPGEIKSGGDGWEIHFGFSETPFGECIVGESPRGICHLAFLDSQGRTAVRTALQETWPGAKLRRDDASAQATAERIFRRGADSADWPRLRAFVKATEFQLRVWNALLQIPPGALTTYGRLAAAIGQPSAARAVGSGVGANPIAFLIPCHRVIRETGAVGDYRWGALRKRAILVWEASSAAQGAPARR